MICVCLSLSYDKCLFSVAMLSIRGSLNSCAVGAFVIKIPDSTEEPNVICIFDSLDSLVFLLILRVGDKWLHEA